MGLKSIVTAVYVGKEKEARGIHTRRGDVGLDRDGTGLGAVGRPTRGETRDGPRTAVGIDRRNGTGSVFIGRAVAGTPQPAAAFVARGKEDDRARCFACVEKTPEGLIALGIPMGCDQSP